MKKSLLAGVMAAVGLMLASTGAQAQTVTYIGTTTGIFASTGTNLSKNGANTVLTFTGGLFNVSTTGDGDFVSIGGDPFIGPNLGTLTVSTGPPNPNFSDTLTLNVIFTAPTTSGGGPFTATVTGKVGTFNNNGLLTASFTPNQQVYNFTQLVPGASGTFDLAVANVPAITSGKSGALTGTITTHLNTATVPEPGTMALMLPGLAPLGLALRRRRKTS